MNASHEVIAKNKFLEKEYTNVPTIWFHYSNDYSNINDSWHYFINYEYNGDSD